MSTNTEMRLQQAILIYMTGGGDKAAATLHPVAVQQTRQRRGTSGQEDVRPLIGAGVPLDRLALRTIADSLAGAPSTVHRAIIPANLLIADPDLLLWHVPEHRRTIFFKTGNKPFDALANGRNALHPHLLFLARPRELYIFALKDAERPTLDTPVWRAPYFNVYLNGHLCPGNYTLPDHCRPDGIPGWERAFFDTNFSHTNIDARELTRHPHGHNAMWQELVKERGRGARKEFPTEWLVPLCELVSEPADLGAKAKGAKAKPAPLLTIGKVIQG